jgi:hypothetical protein
MTADPRRWKALAVLGIAYLMVVLDVSIVNVALPSIQEDLGFSPRTSSGSSAATRSRSAASSCSEGGPATSSGGG